MKLVTVHYEDDNFGDNLIAVCFEQLLKVALKNRGLANDSVIKRMTLRELDSELISNADAVFFAGGGLFGLSYLDFFEPLKKIVKIAELSGVPVVFSSMGINNMGASDENDDVLSELLSNQAIKAVSVRENEKIFMKYLAQVNDRIKWDIKTAADPVTWAEAVYHYNNKTYLKQKDESKQVGINVVRGGLFEDNGHHWGLTNEIEYLSFLRNKLQERGYKTFFYTNGSTLDENTMRYLGDEKNIPRDEIISVDTSRELVELISKCDAVAAIRMHSSILSYAFNIPAVNLVWNDKIPCFYEETGLPDRTVFMEDEDGIICQPSDAAESAFRKIDELLSKGSESRKSDYLMTLYHFLYETIGGLNLDNKPASGESTSQNAENINENASDNKKNADEYKEENVIENTEEKAISYNRYEEYKYEDIVKELSEIPATCEINEIVRQDFSDMKDKLSRSQNRYLRLFKTERKEVSELKQVKMEKSSVQKKYESARNELEKTKSALSVAEKRLEHIDSILIFKLYHKIKSLLKKKHKN